MIAKRIIVKYRIRYDTLPILKYPFIIGIVKNISGVPCEKKKGIFLGDTMHIISSRIILFFN